MRVRIKTGMTVQQKYGSIYLLDDMKALEGREFDVIRKTAEGNYDIVGWYFSHEMLEFIDDSTKPIATLPICTLKDPAKCDNARQIIGCVGKFMMCMLGSDCPGGYRMIADCVNLRKES